MRPSGKSISNSEQIGCFKEEKGVQKAGGQAREKGIPFGGGEKRVSLGIKDWVPNKKRMFQKEKKIQEKPEGGSENARGQRLKVQGHF